MLVESNLSRIRRARDEKATWKKPVPPSPCVLHLNVIARTQYFDDYLECTSTVKSQCGKYVEPLLGQMRPVIVGLASDSSALDTAVTESSQRLTCNKHEAELVENVLCDLIRYAQLPI